MEVFPKLNKLRGKGKRILEKEIGTFILMNLETLDWRKIPLHPYRERNWMINPKDKNSNKPIAVNI